MLCSFSMTPCRWQTSSIFGSWISTASSLGMRTGESKEPTLRVSITRVPVCTTTKVGGGRAWIPHRRFTSARMWSSSSSEELVLPVCSSVPISNRISRPAAWARAQQNS